MHEKDELITMAECRTLREIIHTLTSAPMLTKQEYLRLMVTIDRIVERMENESD